VSLSRLSDSSTSISYHFHLTILPKESLPTYNIQKEVKATKAELKAEAAAAEAEALKADAEAAGSYRRDAESGGAIKIATLPYRPSRRRFWHRPAMRYYTKKLVLQVIEK
jgi:hypothetical protein